MVEWTMAKEFGYEPQTTFWQDFSIADRFGIREVTNTYLRAFREWRKNYIYLTELVMVLNHKIWEHYGHNDLLAATYNQLWKDADAYACEYLEGEEAEYFFRTTD